MPTTLIVQKPNFTKKVEGKNKLSIAEFFCDTLQGEGIHTGSPATFLRLQGCTLQCKWCDTLDVWPHGNEYTFDELFTLLEESGAMKRLLYEGQHLVLTGGSPLLQQEQLLLFLKELHEKYSRVPFIEVENECVLIPHPEFAEFVGSWNNSPKTTNSGMKVRARYKPDVIKHMSKQDNSWFKFVIGSEEDWEEIEEMFLPFISKSQVILMPEGQNQEELLKTRELTVDLAIKHGVRYCDRQHITIWNKKTGV